jgi:RNA polymerase sigma-70 factor (sigma-E family)
MLYLSQEGARTVTRDSTDGVFDELYARHAAAAGRLAYLLTGDRELSEDLVHDAFIKAVGRWRHLRQPEAFEAYLRRTVINLAHSHHRRRSVERRYLQRHGSQLPTSSPAPELELDDALRAALLTLPPRQRAAVVLRFYEDQSEAQTAELLGVSTGTVKSLTWRGMARLREVINDAQH